MAKKKPTFLDKIANAFGYVKGVALTTSAVFGQREYPSAKSADMLGAYISWVYACVKARSRDVARIELKLFKVTNRKTGEVEEVEEHDVLSLIRSVNPFMTSMQLFEHTQAYKDLAGEAFWYLQRANKNGTGMITQIWLLRPDYIDIKTSKDGFITGYEYKVAGQAPITFRPEEIIHHKEFNPINPYRGMGVVRAAATTIDTEIYAEEYNKKFFRNSAVPEVVLSTEQKLTEQQVKRMHAEWNNKYAGTQNAHKTAILEGGLDIKTFSISQKDMEFLEGQGFSRDKILALFEVPKSRLGMTEGVTVSNAEATINIYLKYLVKPLMESMRDTLNEFLLTQYDDTIDMFFDIEDPVPDDVKTDVERMRAMFAMGALTPNEIRDQQGFDQVEGLDSFYLTLNQGAIANEEGAVVPVTDQEGNKIAHKNSKGRKPKVRIPAKMLKHRVGERLTKDITEGVIESIKSAMPTFVAKAKDLGPSNWKQETKEAFWKQLVGKTDNFEKKYEERLIALFDQQEKQVLDRFNSVESKAAIAKFTAGDIEGILISVTTENKVAAELLLPLVKEILEESGVDSMEFVSPDAAFDATTEAIKQFLRTDALKGLRVMNKVTKSKLRKALSQALTDGTGPIETARKIRDVFDEARKVRSLRVARTETLKAANRGALEAYKQSGVVAGKEWFTSLDESVCQWCGPMQGKVQGLDQNFFHEGESLVGKEGGVIKFNLEDVPAPPLHPNCRCTLVPITVSQRALQVEPVEKTSDQNTGEVDWFEKEKQIEERVTAKVEEKVADMIGRVLDDAKDS